MSGTKNGNGNGNGAAASTCPHGCIRCRALELGLDHRPLTQAELVLVHGGVVEPSREGRLVYSAETMEASLRHDVALVAVEDALRTWHEVRVAARAEQNKPRGRSQDFDSAERAATEELNDAKEAAAKAGRRYRALAGRDAEDNRIAKLLESQAVNVAEKDARKAASKSARKGVMARLRP